jgi:hypothetical protein
LFVGVEVKREEGLRGEAERVKREKKSPREGEEGRKEELTN